MDYSIDSDHHTSGQSQYIDDIPLPQPGFYGWVHFAPVGHGRITSFNWDKALAQPGVKGIYTAKDIPGENQIGGIIPDEPLLAEGDIHFFGQPLALVVATSERLAKKAAALIEVTWEALPVITEPREAVAKGELLFAPIHFVKGEVEAGFAQSDVIVEGQASCGGQEHLYLEPQGAVAIPQEGGTLKIISSTQGPTAVQRTCARILGIPMHAVEVEVRRLGGGFGGKEDQATPWACLAGLAAWKLKAAVKLVLPRHEDMLMTGKRHPYDGDFKLGLKRDGTFVAYSATYYQNGGAATDLSPAVLARTLFHGTNAYAVPHVTLTGYSARTNMVPFTAFRGFGGPQGKFVMESAIARASEEMGISAHVLQRKNLLKTGDEFPYGQIAENCHAEKSWKQLERFCSVKELETGIREFNAREPLRKRGMAFMPICFGISFTKTSMNQASSLVHIYSDGSVMISTAAVEMGQGVNSKITQVAAHLFGIDPKRVFLRSTNTSHIANTSPTAASAGADLNGKATEMACSELIQRLKAFVCTLQNRDDALHVRLGEDIAYKGQALGMSWGQLIESAYMARINLSAHAHYATPHIYFDMATNKGRPFAYHVYGTSLTTVTVDALRGMAEVDEVYMVHDFGQSMNSVIDLGQVEGGLAQGIGWMTLEDLRFSPDTGKVLSNTLSTYKVLDWYSAPKGIHTQALKDSWNPMGVFNSKAVGEPPLMYGIGTYFAIRRAIAAFRGKVADLPFSAPYTMEKILRDLYRPFTE